LELKVLFNTALAMIQSIALGIGLAPERACPPALAAKSAPGVDLPSERAFMASESCAAGRD
jgi:hypothetical protein